MSRAAKGWLIAAAVITVLGIASVTGALAAVGFDVNRFATVHYADRSEEVSADFDHIVIDVTTAAVELAPAEGRQCQLTYHEQEKLRFTSEAANRTLTVHTADTREWYDHFGFSLDHPRLTVYLPKQAYRSLTVSVKTGNVTIAQALTFDSVSVANVTGSTDCAADVKGSLSISAVTGNITLQNLSAGSAKLSTTTGNVKTNSVRLRGGVDITTTTGNVKLTDTVAEGGMTVSTTTGNVRFDGCDAAQIDVEATTGNVEGTLLTEKLFRAESVTGKVRVPQSTSGGLCTIRTRTGNIRIAIQTEQRDAALD